MKTTIELPDAVYRQLKARAALTGTTMKALVLDAIREKLKTAVGTEETTGWRAVFGKAPAGSVDEIRAILDQEFSRIDPEDWK